MIEAQIVPRDRRLLVDMSPDSTHEVEPTHQSNSLVKFHY